MKPNQLIFALALATAVTSLHTVRAAEDPGRLDGAILGSGGKPVTNAVVYVYSAAPREGVSPLCPTCHPDCTKLARTDSEGRFTIEPVDSKLMFRLLVAAPGYRPDYIREVDPQFGGATLTLKPLKFKNAAAENRVIARLIGPDGSPIVGARVSSDGYRSETTRSWGSTSGKTDPMAVTDENGEFFLGCTNTIQGLQVLIEPRGFAKRKLWLDTGRAHFLRFTHGATITGRLVRDGKPVPGASIAMSTEDRSSDTFMRGFDGTTDSDGRFRLQNIPPNTAYVLYTKMKGMQELGVALPPQKISTGADGTTAELGELKVGPAYTIQGKIVTSDGQPLPSRTRIYLSLEDAWDNQDTRPDDDGWFQFVGVPATSVSISLRVAGYRISAKNPSKDWLNEGLIVGKLSGNLENFLIHLERGERLTGNDLPTDADRQPRNQPLRSAKP